MLCHAMSDEKCGDAMWNGVTHVENQWWCAVNQDAKCGYGIRRVMGNDG